MAGPSGNPDTTDNRGVRSDRPSDTTSPTTPVWVWVVGIMVVGTALAMIASMTVPMLMGGMGGGGH